MQSALLPDIQSCGQLLPPDALRRIYAGKLAALARKAKRPTLYFFRSRAMEIIHYLTEDGIDIYQRWVSGLRDVRARVIILRRVDRIATGNFGDHKVCRDGVHELRINYGPGYRVYYFQHQGRLVVLLCGGDKQTQDADISRAVAYRADFLRRTGKP